MTSQKVEWARKRLSKELKGTKSKSEKTAVFKRVWKEAHAKFGR